MDAREQLRIKIVGVGGAGQAVINRLAHLSARAELLVIDSDKQSLKASGAARQVRIGGDPGLGTGSNREVGRANASEASSRLHAQLSGADLVLLVAGAAGGTGGGASPVVASVAHEIGALSLAFIGLPFKFEGKRRAVNASEAVRELRLTADSVIAIPYERLILDAPKGISLSDAFKLADNDIATAVESIVDLVTVQGEVNLDLEDLRAVLTGGRIGSFASADAEGAGRAIEAAKRALESLHAGGQIEIATADSVVINITGGRDMTLFEVHEAAALVQEVAAQEASIIFGTVISSTQEARVRVSIIIATNIVAFSKSIVLIWDPLEVAPDDYASLVAALGNLARASGGIGVRRVDNAAADIVVSEGARV